MSKYDKFIKWIELNDLELHDYQKQMLKTVLENEVYYIHIPRRHSIGYGVGLLSKFLSENK